MRQYNKYLPVLGMALYFCSVCLGAILTAASRSFSGSGKLPMLFHMAGIFAVALWLSLCLRRNATLPRVLVPLTAGVAALCLIVPFFTAGESTLSWQFLLPHATAMCLFLPVGLHLFFAVVPEGRQGLALGCAMAAGELVWVAVLPLLHFFLASAHSPEAVLYLYQFLGVSMAGIGACFAISLADPSGRFTSFRLSAKRFACGGVSTSVSPSSAIPAIASGTKPGFFSALEGDLSAAHATRLDAPTAGRGQKEQASKALLWLFLSGVLFYTLFGLVLHDFPRTATRVMALERLHFLLMPVGPAVGFMLDKVLSAGVSEEGGSVGLEAHSSRHVALFILAVLAVPVMLTPVAALVVGHGPALSVPLLCLRQVFSLILLVFAAYVAGRSPYFPLLSCAVWGLMLLHLVGILLGDRLDAYPALQSGADFALALGCVWCLWRFVGIAKTLPRFQNMPSSQAQMPVPDSTPEISAAPLPIVDESKLRTFAATFDLTGREEEVLRDVLQGFDNTAMAVHIGVSERTIRHHIGGLLKKTGTSNRKRLQHFYIAFFG